MPAATGPFANLGIYIFVPELHRFFVQLPLCTGSPKPVCEFSGQIRNVGTFDD